MASYETEQGVFDAISVRGTARYRLNKKMISGDQVPVNIKAQLDYEIAENEKARKARNEAALAEPREFDEIAPAETVVSEPVAPILDSNPPRTTPLEQVDFTEEELQKIVLEEAARRDASTAVREPQPLTAKELADLMYKNYGIWTVFTEKAPNLGDTHPVTGVPMVRYDVGLGYQAVRHGEVKQIFNPSPIENTPVPESAFVGQPNPSGYKTFEQRTAPSFQKQSSTIMKSYENDPISEEPTAEPMLRGQTIRPEW